MSINKKLYESILSGNDLDENINILNTNGYNGYCELDISLNTAFDEFNVGRPDEFYLGRIYASGSGGLSVVGLPPFVSSRVVFSQGNASTTEYYIAAGTSVDYETYGTGPNSTTWDGSVAIAPDCAGSFRIVLNDINDGFPIIGGQSSFIICANTNGFMGSINVSDGDSRTSDFRQITLRAEGTISSSVSFSPSSFTAPSTVFVSFNSIGVPVGTYPFTIIAFDGVNNTSRDCIVSIVGQSSTSFNTYNYLYSIPQGLSGSYNNPIIIGHKITASDYYIYNAIGCTDSFSCLSTDTYNFDGFSSSNSLIKYNSSAGGISNENDILLYISGGTNSLLANTTITGSDTFYFSASGPNIFGSYCCGLSAQDSLDELIIGNPLETFVTGIGPAIPFSGGIGNVEASYFEPLGKNKIILAPQATGVPLSSNDDYFYIYTHGQSTYTGIKHPTQNDLHEVVGAASHSNTDRFILCRYGSDTSRFFRYDTLSATWSTILPFDTGSYITRIAKLERNDGRYLIVGSASGEYAIYNTLANTTVSVAAQGINDVILPASIALIANTQQADCFFNNNLKSENMVSYDSKYHIFALNHHYTGTNVNNNDYPLLLDTANYILTSGEFNLAGNTGLNTTYLHSYLNYRTDIVTVADKMVISLSNTGTGASEAIIRDNTTHYISNILSTGTDDRRRLTKLVNDQILWSAYSPSGSSIVIDPYHISTYSLPTPLVASISVAASCNTEYRTLMLNASGNKAYILNDLDRTYQEVLFTGNLAMGTYHDIMVFDRLSTSVDQSHNFYLMPTQIYDSGFPKGNLAVLSTTTSSAYGVNLSGAFSINETVISFAPIQTTTGLIAVGYFTLDDDEFTGGVNIGFDQSLGDGSIFTATITGQSGTIYVKSGIALDYETKNLYTGYITGIDPYVGGSPFIDSFVMQVLNIDEKPTDIIITPPDSGTINSNTSTANNVQLATFTITDPDDDAVNVNIVNVAGPDRNKFVVTFNNTNQNGILYLKAGTILDVNIQEEYNITLLASKSGETFSASKDWKLELTDNPPVSVIVSPNIISLPEDYIIPSTGLKLADFILVDNDTNKGNYVELIGTDSSYFTINYDRSVNSGTLRLNASQAFDYEIKPKITGQIAAGNTAGIYSATGIFTINITDVYEPTGIRVSPSIVYINENADTSTGTIKLADLSWSANVTDPMVVFDVRYTGGGFRSALDKFQIVRNVTLTPEIHLQQLAQLDYETQNRYDIYVSGRPSTSTTNLYGGYLIVIVRDVNEAPIVSFNPTGITIPETIPTNAGRFKLADVLVSDEQLSTVSLSLGGNDSNYFTLIVSTGISDSSASIDIADLYFNSGIIIDINTKDRYTGTIIATDSSGLSSTGNFIVSIGDIAQCDLVINADINSTTCTGDTNGRIFLDISYTGTNEDVISCNSESPISVQWNNLPITAVTGFNGTVVNNLSNGNYSGHIFGGNIPLTGISYTISSTSNLELLQVIKDQSICSNSGTLTVTWSGGIPPYSVTYGTNSTTVASGSGFTANIIVVENTTANPVIRDSVGCDVSGGTISFSFISSSFTYESQSPPILYDDTLESFQCYVSHGQGPYEVNIYATTTGEKGSLVQTFDRYDTSIINAVDRLSNIITDIDGNQSVRLNNPNPEIYYYDFQNKLYPGQYIFEFINADNCSLLTDQQILQNISPMIAQITATNDNPVDNGFYTLAQPILDTLFIPYKMLVDNNNLLSYLSNISEKSDIHLQIGDTIYDRKVLNGSINCDNYSILNIKFLGLNNVDWFYTMPIYQGFDLTDTTLNILDQDIYLILPDQSRIKVVTELNNNVNTIKLLKGSILTTDLNTAQYKDTIPIELFNYDFDTGSFVSMNVSSSVAYAETLYNKYIPGNMFRIDFLNNRNISQDLRSDSIQDVSFDCNNSQVQILKNRTFLLSLNTFGLASNIYSKSISFAHSASITTILEGAYGEYNIIYYYYDKVAKCLSELSYNNDALRDFNAEGLISGVYIVKLRDIYGNKLQIVNNTNYDYFYISALDFILNELDTTPENLNFEYGDILLNLVNLLINPNPGQTIPGIENEQPISLPDPVTPIIITTNTYEISPNKEYNNSIIIQTSPGKIPYTITGPYGYHKKFYDRSVLIQLPPGVYTIAADYDSLQDNYLYQQIKKLNITKNTNILVNMIFDTYRDRVIIKDSCKNII